MQPTDNQNGEIRVPEGNPSTFRKQTLASSHMNGEFLQPAEVKTLLNWSLVF